jgi:hypothetical protein
VNDAPPGPRFTAGCLLLALALALLVRAPYDAGNDFVPGDGALFLRMLEALRANGYALPFSVEFNGRTLPFAYPPLGFYLGAALIDLGLPPLAVLRWVPLVFNLATVVLAVLLAARVLRRRDRLLYAALLFPLLPQSYEWLIMGGGLTRSPGFAFTLLALLAATYAGSPAHRRSALVLCALALAAALLTHLEWGVTAGVAVTLWLVVHEGRASGRTLLALGAAAAALSAPWWLAVIARHGVAPFAYASKTGYWNISLFAHSFLTLDLLRDNAYLIWPVVIGWLDGLGRRRWFVPLWLVAIFVTTPRHAPSPATVPVALLAAAGLSIAGAYVMDLVRAPMQGAPRARPFLAVLEHAPLRVPNYVLIIALFAGVYVLRTEVLNGGQAGPLGVLSPGARAGMDWIARNTPADAAWVVLSPTDQQPSDYTAEWFPVLAGRRSLTTAQGLEWLPDEAFLKQIQLNNTLRHYQDNAPGELAGFVAEQFCAARYVAVFIAGTPPDYGGFLASGRYELVYNEDAVVIFAKTGATPCK